MPKKKILLVVFVFLASLYYALAEIQISVHGTEYQVGDNGKVFLQLLEDYQPITNASCYVYIYNPDMGHYLENQLMLESGDGQGIYYYDLLIPNQTGVYPVHAICYYAIIEQVFYPNTSKILSGELEGGSISDVYAIDGETYDVKEAGGDNDILAYSVNWTSLEYPDFVNLSSIDVQWRGLIDYDGGDVINLTFYGYNYNLSRYEQLSSSFQPPDNVLTTFSFSMDNETFRRYFNEGVFTLKVNATATDIPNENLKKLKTDYLAMLYEYYEPSYQVHSIRGSSELHVSEDTTLIYQLLQNVWSFLTVDIWGSLTSIQLGVNESNDKLDALALSNNESIDELRQNLTAQIEELKQVQMYMVSD